MRQAPGGNPTKYECAGGEPVTIKISPIGVGNTFVVSAPAVLTSGGNSDSRHTEYLYEANSEAGHVQVISMKFRFPVAVPEGGFTPATWPRFELTLKGGEGNEFKPPTVLQSSTATVPSEQVYDLLFQTA